MCIALPTRDHKGAVFVEAAIVFATFLLVILAFFDLARIMWMQSQLTVAAEQALTLAATDPGIDYYDFEKSAAEQPEMFKRAENRVLERARRITYSGWIKESDAPITEESLKIPRTSPQPGVLMEQLLETTPIEIDLQANYDSLLPFLKGTVVRGRAVGYREPRKMANMPVIVDCNGNLLGSPMYEVNPCPCPADKMWDFTRKKCVCRNNPNNDGTCGCPGNRELTSDYTQCVCKTASCEGNQRQNSSTCDCACPLTNAVNASTCECIDNAIRVGDECRCDNAGVPVNTRRLGTSCTLSCIATTMQPVDGNINNGCECRVNFTSSGSSCLCNHQSCPNNEWRGSACGDCGNCGVRAGRNSSGECVCPSSDYVMATDTRSCNCQANSTCPKTGMTRTLNGNCACACPTGMTEGATQCECTDPNRVRSGSSCVCRSTPVEPCPVDSIWNTSLCACRCKNNQQGSPGACTCPGSSVRDANFNCVCPGTPPAGGFFAFPSCEATCPGGKVLFQGACVNPECAISRCAAFTVGDGSCSGCPET